MICLLLFVLMLMLGSSPLLAQSRAQGPAASSAPQTIAHGLFSDVQVFRPDGTPRQFVLLLSDNPGPDAGERRMIRKMVAAGAMVAAVPLGPFYRRLETQDGKCTYAPGAFENLARHLQAFERLPTYLVPMIVGSGDAASFAYALLAQAPGGTFASAMSLGFCPALALKTPPCAVNALRWRRAVQGVFDLEPAAALAAPWAATPAGAGAACTPEAARAFVERVPHGTWISGPQSTDLPQAFEAVFARLAVKQVGLGPPPAQLAGLPIVEMPVAETPAPVPPGAGAHSRFAVLLSGDGGWAGIDKGIAKAFVAKGVPVVGFDSLRYFWSARTPEGLATDLDRVIRYYAHRWKRSDVILIGYSQGADVLPFAINRLPAATRERVHLTVLLGVGQKASFEFHLSNWIGPSGDKPIAPEARKLSAASTLCVYGKDERDSLCPELVPEHARAMPLAGGHHFGGDYDALAARILDALPR